MLTKDEDADTREVTFRVLSDSKDFLILFAAGLKKAFPHAVLSTPIPNKFESGYRLYGNIKLCKNMVFDSNPITYCAKNPDAIGICSTPCPYRVGTCSTRR